LGIRKRKDKGVKRGKWGKGERKKHHHPFNSPPHPVRCPMLKTSAGA